jgi:hypothetical protein
MPSRRIFLLPGCGKKLRETVALIPVEKKMNLFPMYITRPTGRKVCQMAYFQTKNRNLGKFGMVLQWKMLVNFLPFDLFYGYLAYFVVIWYIFPVLVFCTKKYQATLQGGKVIFFYV